MRDLMTASRRLAETGRTILLVEENIAETLALAQRVYIIDSGHMAYASPAQEIKAQSQVMQHHLGV